MAKIIKIGIDGKNYYYYTNMRSDDIQLYKTKETDTANQKGSSEFFFEGQRNILAKIKNDKYPASILSVKWLARIFHERILWQADSIKEFQGSKIFKRAGLCVAKSYGYAIALNPYNKHSSIFFLEYIPSATRGIDYFNQAESDEKLHFIDRFCQDISNLAKINFYSRDAHFGNILITKENDVIWVDTHVYRLPILEKHKYQTLFRFFTKKIPLDYRAVADKLLRKHLNISC